MTRWKQQGHKKSTLFTKTGGGIDWYIVMLSIALVCEIIVLVLQLIEEFS